MSFLRLLAAVAATFGLAAAAHAEPAVGFQHLSMPDPAGPAVEIGVWYPTEATPKAQQVGLIPAMLAMDAPASAGAHPLVVISHGNGGSFASHIDTAVALAHAGYVVAALTHTGDNYRDQSRAVDLANRPRQLKLLVDYMLTAWAQRAAVDPGRIGAFGFSSGGFTVLVAAGGIPDLGQIKPHCAAHPDYFDCKLVARFPAAVARLDAAPDWTRDARLKAVVAAAPALGYSFGQAGLSQATLPLQLWRAEFDHILPQPDYAEAVDRDLPVRPDYRVVANADHFDFLAPCSQALRAVAPDICVSRPGFDRTAFHAEFDRAVVAFFDAHLKP